MMIFWLVLGWVVAVVFGAGWYFQSRLTDEVMREAKHALEVADKWKEAYQLYPQRANDETTGTP